MQNSILVKKIKDSGGKLLLLLLIVCITLLILHGFQERTKFIIDEVSIGLLVLCFIPFFRKIFSSIKAGGVELQFKDYSVHEQIFIFLDGVASRQEWTFFNPRKGEISLGEGFKVLIDELLKNKKKELLNQLKTWFESDNDNHKWFAAEVIGYAKISELKPVCKSYFENLDIDEYWQHWQLNSLWAYSTFYSYEPLISKLELTKNEANRRWLILACIQMIKEEKNADVKLRLQDALNKFPQALIDSLME